MDQKAREYILIIPKTGYCPERFEEYLTPELVSLYLEFSTCIINDVLANNCFPAQPVERVRFFIHFWSFHKFPDQFLIRLISDLVGAFMKAWLSFIYLFICLFYSFIYLFIFYLYSTESPILHFLAFWLVKYRQVSNTRRTKSQHFKDSRTVLRLSLANPLKPDGKSRMKM